MLEYEAARVCTVSSEIDESRLPLLIYFGGLGAVDAEGGLAELNSTSLASIAQITYEIASPVRPRDKWWMISFFF